ncbi:hypothetical protein FO519_007640 [Halicephalobus sp. NKZ332]|nr:hypothetical protein FO519_007640 [Halicephalobus sp. NKZ332]
MSLTPLQLSLKKKLLSLTEEPLTIVKLYFEEFLVREPKHVLFNDLLVLFCGSDCSIAERIIILHCIFTMSELKSLKFGEPYFLTTNDTDLFVTFLVLCYRQALFDVIPGFPTVSVNEKDLIKCLLCYNPIQREVLLMSETPVALSHAPCVDRQNEYLMAMVGTLPGVDSIPDFFKQFRRNRIPHQSNVTTLTNKNETRLYREVLHYVHYVDPMHISYSPCFICSASPSTSIPSCRLQSTIHTVSAPSTSTTDAPQTSQMYSAPCDVGFGHGGSTSPVSSIGVGCHDSLSPPSYASVCQSNSNSPTQQSGQINSTGSNVFSSSNNIGGFNPNSNIWNYNQAPQNGHYYPINWTSTDHHEATTADSGLDMDWDDATGEELLRELLAGIGKCSLRRDEEFLVQRYLHNEANTPKVANFEIKIERIIMLAEEMPTILGKLFTILYTIQDTRVYLFLRSLMEEPSNNCITVVIRCLIDCKDAGMQLDPEMVNLSISACLKFLTPVRAARTSDESRTIRLILAYFSLAVSSFSDMIADRFDEMLMILPNYNYISSVSSTYNKIMNYRQSHEKQSTPT